MRSPFSGLIPAIVSVLAVLLAGPSPVAAQTTEGAFDPRDFSGIYIRRGGDRGFPVENMPTLTPEGAERLSQNKSPGRSRHPLVQNVDLPELSNDPAFTCNPKGIPRIILDTAHDFHEVVMLPDRMLQLWQEERRPRMIWIDGRELPSGESLDDLGPKWMGHSVGEWEGDTLVVNTVGLDTRAWLDSFGFVKSADARIEERYSHPDADTIELQVTLYDPTYYAGPWVTDVKIWKKEARENVTFFGWYGLFSGLGELICAPANASPVSPRGG